MSVAGPTLIPIPSDLSDKERQKWRAMYTSVPGFKQLVDLPPIDVEANEQPPSAIPFARALLNDVVSVQDFHTIEGLKTSLQPESTVLTLSNGSIITFLHADKRIEISYSTNDNGQSASIAGFLKQAAPDWNGAVIDTSPIVSESTVAAPEPELEESFVPVGVAVDGTIEMALQENMQAPSPKAEPTVDEQPSHTNAGPSETMPESSTKFAREANTKNPTSTTEERAIEVVGFERASTLAKFKIIVQDKQKSFQDGYDFAHKKIPVESTKKRYKDKYDQAIKAYGSLLNDIAKLEAAGIHWAGYLPEGEQPTLSQMQHTVATLLVALPHDTKSELKGESDQALAMVDKLLNVAKAPSKKRHNRFKHSWKRPPSLKAEAAETLQSHTPATWGWANDWKVTQAEPNLFASIPIVRDDPPTKSGNATAARRLNDRSNRVTRYAPEIAIGLGAFATKILVTKAFVAAGISLTGPVGIIAALGLTLVLGGATRVLRARIQKNRDLKAGKTIPEVQKGPWWKSNFVKGAAISGLFGIVSLGASEFLTGTDIGKGLVSSFKNAFFGTTDIAQAADGAANPASPTTPSPAGADPASLATAPQTVQQILSSDQITKLPENLQKLANTTDPQKLVKFCNEASAYLYSHNVGVHDDASKAAKKAASDLIEMGLRVAKEKGISGSAVNQLFANDSFFSLHGIGRAVDTVKATLSATESKGAIHNYGTKAIKYMARHGMKM